MVTTEANPLEFREGINDPSPISRLIALDWYDGPTEGVLQLGDSGPIFRFQMLDERIGSPENEDVRVYGLYPLPVESIDRLVELLSPTHTPNWPVWWPIWKFPSDDVRLGIEKQTDEIMSQSGPLSWILVGHIGSGPVRALPVQVARAS